MPVERFDELRAEDGRDLAGATGSTRSTSRSATRCRTPGRCSAWARQRDLRVRRSTTSSARARTRESRVGVWTRELIDAALAGRRHLLPALPAARDASSSSTRAYPRAQELFALKRQLDPELPAAATCSGTRTTRLARSRGAAERAGRVASSTLIYAATSGGRRLLPVPAERLLASSRGPLPHCSSRRRLRRAPGRRGDLPAICRPAPEDQAVPVGAVLRAAVARQAEAGDGAADASSCWTASRTSTATSRSAPPARYVRERCASTCA